MVPGKNLPHLNPIRYPCTPSSQVPGQARRNELADTGRFPVYIHEVRNVNFAETKS